MASHPYPRRNRFRFQLHHDMALLAQVNVLKPFDASKPNVIWNQLAANLNLPPLRMQVKRRTCRDRVELIYSQLAQIHKVEQKEINEWMKEPKILLQKLRCLKQYRNKNATSTATAIVQNQEIYIPNSNPRPHASSTSTQEIILGASPFDHVISGFENYDPIEIDPTSPAPPLDPLRDGCCSKKLDLSYRMLMVEKHLIELTQITKRQDAVHQEILHELKSLREVVINTAKNTVVLPNPFVRLERLPKGKAMAHTLRKERSHRKKLVEIETGPGKRKGTFRSNTEHTGQSFESSPSPPMDPPSSSISNSTELNEETTSDPTSTISTHHVPVKIKVEVGALDPNIGSGVDFNQDLDAFMSMAASLAGTMPAPKQDNIIRSKQKISPQPMKCDHCAAVLSSTWTLRKHILKRHEKNRPFICATCGKAFPLEKQLTHHEQIHTADKPYKCRYCESSFRQQQGLYIHERRHLVGIRYGRSQCAQCGQLFVSEYNMRKHVGLVHNQERRFPCHICSKPFKTSTHLKYHLGTHERPCGRQRGLNREPGEDGEGGKSFRIKRIGGVGRIKQASVVMDLDDTVDVKHGDSYNEMSSLASSELAVNNAVIAS